MRRWLVVATLVAACGDDLTSGPYDALPLEVDLQVGLDHPVHVARDKYGIAHINARSVGDAAFAQGYVMAHDRLPQMDILRRFGEGRLSELFGALDPTVIDTDLEMRMHRMEHYAQATWDRLQASDDPTDQQLVTLLQRFTDGVNTYAHAIKTETNATGTWDLDPRLLDSFDPSRFKDWRAVDSLALGRFQAFALSWSTPFELDVSEMYDGLRSTYDAAQPANADAYARRGISSDFMTFAPVGAEFTIPEFPNVGTDRGTRSDGSDGPDVAARAVPPPPAAPGTPRITRPHVPTDVYEHARAFFARTIRTGPFGALGPHAFMRPWAGSNNWAVGPADTADGSAMLATDQHLQLPNPSIFYPTHLIIRDVVVATDTDSSGNTVQHPLDVIGLTFPGIPGVILGTNGYLAWSGTVSEHDVNDVYAETIAPCTVDASHACAAWSSTQVQLESFTEEIEIGALGTKTGSVSATYETVPHHGTIIPTIDKTAHVLVPRTGNTALSVAYTGDKETFEIRAIWKLAQATSVHDGFAALADFSYGSQNWTMIDRQRQIGWTTNAVIPLRDPRAYQWNATANPDGLAPFFVLPGDGTADWQTQAGATVSMDPRYIPHARTRDGETPAKFDYLVTANADPVGATADNDPLNGPLVDGRPLYAGVTYAEGLRAERIATMIRDGAATPAKIDQAAMERMQHDTRSTMGAKMQPYLMAALARLDGTTGAPSDVAPYLAGLATEDHDRLVRARALLGSWTFATPTGLDMGDSLGDSAATALFNTWMHFFIQDTLADELGQLPVPFDVWRLDDALTARIIYALVHTPGRFVQSSLAEPILCDRLSTPADDSCTKMMMLSLVEAMTHLESAAGYGTADTTQWKWGDKHRLSIKPLFPNTALDLPGANLPGFPKRGDNSVVNRADQGWSDLDFSQFADGPAQRFVAVADGTDAIRVRWALPGGVIFDSRSPHYRDLLDNYYLPETHFDAPITRDEIVRDGETRWVFR